MSKRVQGITQIRDLLILKKTLEEMGISYKELSAERIAWGAGYDHVEVNLESGKVSYDEMRKQYIDNVQQNYSKNFILQQIAIKGHRIESVKTVGADIEIIAGY